MAASIRRAGCDRPRADCAMSDHPSRRARRADGQGQDDGRADRRGPAGLAAAGLRPGDRGADRADRQGAARRVGTDAMHDLEAEALLGAHRRRRVPTSSAPRRPSSIARTACAALRAVVRRGLAHRLARDRGEAVHSGSHRPWFGDDPPAFLARQARERDPAFRSSRPGDLARTTARPRRSPTRSSMGSANGGSSWVEAWAGTSCRRWISRSFQPAGSAPIGTTSGSI